MRARGRSLAGSAPDLGADEFNQAAAAEMTAVKLAVAPVWMNLPDPGGNPSANWCNSIGSFPVWIG